MYCQINIIRTITNANNNINEFRKLNFILYVYIIADNRLIEASNNTK